MVSLKILPLKCYDVILGMDWLELYSPMEVHWKSKWMSFLYKEEKIELQGIIPDLSHYQFMDTSEIENLQKNDEIWCVLQLYNVQLLGVVDNCPKAIQALLSQFSELFEEPTELPPNRPYDHSIHLLPGAQPFRLRPCRYNPEQKDEIEHQVSELLKNGMIQTSTSPFASPALLVKKKT